MALWCYEIGVFLGLSVFPNFRNLKIDVFWRFSEISVALCGVICGATKSVFFGPGVLSVFPKFPKCENWCFFRFSGISEISVALCGTLYVALSGAMKLAFFGVLSNAEVYQILTNDRQLNFLGIFLLFLQNSMFHEKGCFSLFSGFF